MGKTEEYLSQSKYAEHRNVTKSYITRLIRGVISKERPSRIL